MRFLIPLCMCLGLSVAQQGLPQYYQGSYNIPRAPIPSPGAWNGGATGGVSYGTPQASATLASARPQWSSPATVARAVQYGGGSPVQSYGASPSYASASPSYGAASPLAYRQAAAPVPQAAPVSSIPSSYGWNVQHSSPPPAPAPQPQAAVIPTQYAPPQAAAPQAYRPAPAQYASPQIPSPVQYPTAQYGAAPQPQTYASPARTWSPPAPAAAPAWSPAAPQAAAPAAAYQSPANPISNALARPASVHYASIGENLNGDYKFGYKTDNGFREEQRAPDGTVMGQYGFTDADGKQRVVKYSAGVNGYQVLNDGSAPAAAAAPRAAPAAVAPAIPNWAQQSAGQWSAQPAAAAPQQQWG